MAQLNDCKFDALRAQGYTGAIDDMEKDWGADNNLPNGTVGTPWYDALVNNGIAPAQINDMEFEFWCNQGGSFNLQPVSGFTDGDNCSGGGLYVMNFNNSITFTSHAGVTFFNVTTGDTGTVVSATFSASSQIIYTVTWGVAPPISGQVVEFRYDAVLGNYKNVNKVVEVVNLDDTFSGAAGALNATTPDNIGAGVWAASGQFTLNGTGQVEYNFTNNSQIAIYPLLTNLNHVIGRLRFTAGANTSHVAGFMIRGFDTNNNVSGMILASGNLQINQRDAGAETLFSTTNLTIDPRSGYFTYIVRDDGVNISIECQETGDIASIAISGNITVPADNNVGLYYRNVSAAGEILVDSIIAEDDSFEQMETQNKEITNCLDAAGTYTASIYEGTKDINGTESLASGVTGVRISNSAGVGTIVLSVDGTPLTPSFDTTLHDSYWWPVSGAEISWTMTGVTSFDLGQGKV